MNLICLFASLALSATPAISAVNALSSPVEGEYAYSYREHIRKRSDFVGSPADFSSLEEGTILGTYGGAKIDPDADGDYAVSVHSDWCIIVFAPSIEGYYDVVLPEGLTYYVVVTSHNVTEYISPDKVSYYDPSFPSYNGTLFVRSGVSVGVCCSYSGSIPNCRLIPHSQGFSGVQPERYIYAGPTVFGVWDVSPSTVSNVTYGSYLYRVVKGRSYYVSGSRVSVIGCSNIWQGRQDAAGDISIKGDVLLSDYVRYSSTSHIIVPTEDYLIITPTRGDDYPSVGYFVISVNEGGEGGFTTLDLPEHFTPFELWSNEVDYVNGLVYVDGLNVALPGLVLTGFDFSCNGRYYNAMQIYLQYIWGNVLYDGANFSTWPGNKTGYYCMGGVTYRLLDESYNLVYEDSFLCNPGYTFHLTDNQTDVVNAVVPSHVTWIDDSWRHISILEDKEIVTARFRYRYSDLTDIQLLNHICGGELKVSNVNIIGLSNVNSVLRVAFDGVLPLLSVDILPGISIGLLLFLPLIGLIIVVIIKVVRK